MWGHLSTSRPSLQVLEAGGGVAPPGSHGGTWPPLSATRRPAGAAATREPSTGSCPSLGFLPPTPHPRQPLHSRSSSQGYLSCPGTPLGDGVMSALWMVSTGLKRADGLEFRRQDEAGAQNRALFLPGKCFLSGKHQQIKNQFCRGMSFAFQKMKLQKLRNNVHSVEKPE